MKKSMRKWEIVKWICTLWTFITNPFQNLKSPVWCCSSVQIQSMTVESPSQFRFTILKKKEEWKSNIEKHKIKQWRTDRTKKDSPEENKKTNSWVQWIVENEECGEKYRPFLQNWFPIVLKVDKLAKNLTKRK
jgi:hypothetical protein